ncbi:hypothetical protein EAH57_06340 [Acinetobacter sp. 2JN-4]|uniref:hypothetical protein n=1 Tax=Acinetobacter sp. 2JN-4 TaxID=2479844 RepID=UPI000EF9C2E7|nr:hypothetical protein [Acinetobacter sp. 2JN-4]RLZ09517.1 hypothetical protein EAH57_06340 [Acinetobacter sp. 2JN-4]
MNHSEKQEKFYLSYRRVFIVCLAAYCYSSWLSLVLAKWLPFAKAENVYFAVFISFIFFIFYIIFTSSVISKLWFWPINSLGIFLLVSYWLLAHWGVA